MKDLSKSFKIFFMMITGLALLAIAWAVFQTNWTQRELLELLVFGVLGIVSESLPVPLPKGGYVTVGFAIFYASVIMFPVGVSLLVGAAGGLFVFGLGAKDQPLFKRVFNASQYALSMTAGWSVLIYFHKFNFSVSLWNLPIYVLVALSYMVINITIVNIALGALMDKSPWAIWISNMRWAIPNFLALAPLGYLMAAIYTNYGPIALFLLFIPLLLSRHSFQLYMDMRQNYLNTVEALIQALEAKDAYTSGHSDRVAQLAVKMAERLKLTEAKIEFIKYAAVLHDVGKIGVSEIILNKKGALLDSEWKAIKNHPAIGQNIINKIEFLYEIGPAVRHHHERFDGKGYPDGLQGQNIPLESRIIAIADTYDAITSDRSYRKGRSRQEAMQELRTAAGSQLDPELVEVFLELLASQPEIEQSAFGEIVSPV